MLLALVFCLLPKPAAATRSTAAGAGVAIVAVIDGHDKSAWTAEGEPLAGNPLGANMPTVEKFAVTGEDGDRIVVARIPGQSSDAPTVSINTSSDQNPAAFVVRDSAHRSAWLAGTNLPAALDRANVNIGVAAGPWKPIGTVLLKKGIMGEKKGQGFLMIVRPEDRGQNGKSQSSVVADVAMPTDLTRHTYRVRLFDGAGKPYASSISIQKPNDPGSFSYSFLGRFEDAARIELQARPYVWKSFPNVALHRKQVR